MDFVERIFRISPDGGSGVLEFALILAPLVGVALLYVRRTWTSARHVADADSTID
jgi:hypothetical protein